MAEQRDELRAADSDRQFVAERLRTALNEGRLNLAEYDERLQQAYAAKTYGELDRILDDLPNTVSAEHSQVAPAPPAASGTSGTTGAPGTPAPAPGGRRKDMPPPLLAIWGSWLTATLVCTVIYLLTGFPGYPWPVWVAGPWGAILLGRTIMAYASGDPHGYVVNEQRRRAREQSRNQARWERRQGRWR